MNKNQIINIVPHSYHSVLSDIIQKVNMARYLMIKTVNTETVQLYWQIGKIVSEKINIEKWGNSVVEKLSKDLQTEFPGVKGFSVRNIRYMKSFYETYKVNLKLQPLVAEIGWVQNSIIIEKCKDLLEREFYIRQIKDKGWSKSDLLEKIERQYYQNQLLSQNNFENTVSDDLKARVAWEFIDDYNIEILNPDQPIAKKELENSIVKNIVRFLDEMGGNFAFVGRQFKIEFRGHEYFIDLLFFNFKLNCYVVFELKAREFSPKDLGQLQMYLLAVNEVIKQSSHENTIGILICRNKDRLIVEYLLNTQTQPMGVATYNKYYHLTDIPHDIAKYLPSEDTIIQRLNSNLDILDKES